MNFVVAGAAFLASSVEFVEAFTIVLAVGVIKGWRSALVGALAGAVALGIIVAVFGLALVHLVPLPVLRLVIGVLLLLFGLRWLRKALLRFSGYKALHDEAEAFREEEEILRRHAGGRGALDWYGATTSFNGVLLEGLEVAFIVIAFGSTAAALPSAVIGASVAALVVMAAGVALRAPLQAVPENWLKFVVGILLTSFGTFWAGEGLGVGWPGADASLIPLVAVYLGFSWLAVGALRRRRLERQAAVA